MDLCENQDFLELRDNAVKLLDNKEIIGKCCTVDCIVGVIKKYYNDLATHEMRELIEIMKKLTALDEIRDQELKNFYNDLIEGLGFNDR